MRAFAAAFLICLFLPCASAQQAPDARPAYPDTSGGLKKNVTDVLEAIKANRQPEIRESLRAFILEDSAVWFRTTFGERWGGPLGQPYARDRLAIPGTLFELFSQVLQLKMTEVEVTRFDNSCDSRAGERQHPTLAMRQAKTPLYEVRFHRGTTSLPVWFFAYVDHGFRYLGNIDPSRIELSSAFPASAFPDSPTRHIRSGGKVQQAKLLEQPPPVYPERARRVGLQGSVRMLAVIDKDGRIRDLQVTLGHCWLAEAARDAVRKWRYSPTLLEGQPVEVVTTIDVVFTQGIR